MLNVIGRGFALGERSPYAPDVPELPEVEIVKCNLQVWSVGRVVDGVDASAGGRVEGELQRLRGRRVSGWERRGKLLIGRLGDVALLSHLGMTGKWVRAPGERRFQRITLDLDDGSRLALVDARRLGRTWVLDEADLGSHPWLQRLGPDPLKDGLGAQVLRARVGVGRVPLKTRLLDQGRVAGLGNICVIEGCFRARLHPHTPAGAVPDDRWAALAEGLLGHIHDTLRHESGDEVAYINEGGPNPFAVYGREGQGCPDCGGPILRQVLSARPSFLCPACQPLPGGPP